MAKATTSEVEALERERERLETMLANDPNWRLLQDLEAGRSLGRLEPTTDPVELARSLKTVLSLNRYYLARSKVLEAITLLADHDAPDIEAISGAPAAAPAHGDLERTIKRARRSGLADRMVLLDEQPRSMTRLSAGEHRHLQQAKATASLPALAAPLWPVHQRAKFGAEADRLELISGLDSTHKNGLTRLGVTSFAAIAAWTEGDVGRIGAELDCRAVIGRECWIEQAAVLAAGRQTSYAQRVEAGIYGALVRNPSGDEGEPGDLTRFTWPEASLIEHEANRALSGLGVVAATTMQGFDGFETDVIQLVELDAREEPGSAAAAAPQTRDETVTASLPTPVSTAVAAEASNALGDEPFLVLNDHDAIRFDDEISSAEPQEAAIFRRFEGQSRTSPEPLGRTVALDVKRERPPPIPIESMTAIEQMRSRDDKLIVPGRHVPSPEQPAIKSIFDAPARPLAEPPPRLVVDATPKPDSMMQRLAQLETELSNLEAKPSFASRNRAAAQAMPRKAPRRTQKRLDGPVAKIEDEEFPELKVDEAELTIVKRDDARPDTTPRFASDHTAIVNRMRRVFEPAIEADQYAGYQGEIEEATVEIVRRTTQRE